MCLRRASLLMIIICLTLSACDRDKPAPQPATDDDGNTAHRTAVDNDGDTAPQTMRGVRRESLKLMANDAEEGDAFGMAVAVEGNIAIIGAPSPKAEAMPDLIDIMEGTVDLRKPIADDKGSAYVFDITTGEQLLKLRASDATDGDWFGLSVAVSGNIALIGAPGRARANAAGAAYVFDITTGEQLLKLAVPDDADGRWFGTRVAIDGGIAMIAASPPGYAEVFPSGAVYLFDVTTGEQLFKLTASDAAAGDGFGASVTIVGNIAVVTSRALRADENQAYVFDATTGAQLLKFPFSGEGNGVSVHDNIAIITSFRGGDEGEVTVSTHLYDITTGEQLRELTVDSRVGF